MFAHSSKKVTWRLYRSQPFNGDLRRLGDYATASKLLYAHRTLNGTRWFRKLLQNLSHCSKDYQKLISFILKRIQ
nr:MAG TPA: hypothetical protein [Caudoviricetes sp.]